jgi:hypothetical protein
MTPRNYVEEAKQLARTLERLEAAAASVAIPEAHRRISRRFGIPQSVFYSLRYGTRKAIPVDIFQRLIAAVEFQAAEQIKALHHEIQTARTCGAGADNSYLRAAENALVNARYYLDAAKSGQAYAWPDEVLQSWPGGPEIADWKAAA